VGGATDTSLMEAAVEALVIVVVDVLEVVLVVVIAGCSSSTLITVVPRGVVVDK
jgi:hypothetical protein